VKAPDVLGLGGSGGGRPGPGGRRVGRREKGGRLKLGIGESGGGGGASS
jgi:hypothetical protein